VTAIILFYESYENYKTKNRRRGEEIVPGGYIVSITSILYSGMILHYYNDIILYYYYYYYYV